MAIFFTEGVKYIKIARYDALGNDNYQSLRQLDNVRINTNDRGIISYPVLNITEYPSSSTNSPYFLYEIATTNATSSTNNQVLDYRVEAQDTVAFTFDPSTGAEFYFIDDYDLETFNSLNYLDTASGKYILGNTPNIPIIITASADWNNNLLGSPAATNPIISLRKIIGPTTDFTQIILQKSSSAAALSGTITLSGSFFPIEGETYGIYVSDTLLNNSTRFTGITLILTQSATPVAGIGAQTILEPYITTPFINSDYDVLMNNAVINRPNSFYLDVDFADSQILPINQQAILGNSATPAVIQDSNYSSKWWASSRYNGQQLRSAKLNQWSSTDIAPSKTPNVSNPKSYFVRFNWLGGTSPEWGNNFKGKTNVSIKYIIDENGNEVPPLFDENGINLGNIQQAFGSNNATLVLSNPDSFGVNLDSVNNTIPVFRAGQKIKPIIYTQIASYDNNGNVTGFSFIGSINFAQPDGQTISTGVNNYSMTALSNNPTVIGINDSGNILTGSSVLSLGGDLYTIPFSPMNIGNSASFFTGSSPVQNYYKPTGSLGSLFSSGYILYFDIDLPSVKSSGDSILYSLQSSIDNGANWENIYTTLVSYPNTDVKITYTERYATTSSLYRLAFNIQTISNTLTISPKFIVRQYPAASFNQTSTSCTLFWVTGSSPNILLANTGSVSAGGLNQFVGFQQQNINNSGFDPITMPFNLQPNDEIRFQGLENLSFTITNITQSTAGQLQLNLDNNIPNGTNLDYFLIRRYIPDPGNIILDISKPAGPTSDGILIPEFLGEKATETKEKIISLLRAQS